VGAPAGFGLACRAQRAGDSAARVVHKPVPPIPHESTKIRELGPATPASKLGQGLFAVLYPLISQKIRRVWRVVIGELVLVLELLGKGMVSTHPVIARRVMTL
jgi:hypothetical protein